MTSIYTKTGDNGTTALLGPHRVEKNCPIINSVGELDELSAFIGSARLVNDFKILAEVQQTIYLASAAICAVGEKAERMFAFPDGEIEKLENLIDLYSSDLPELKSFIYPGSNEASTRLHIARAVCRRVERSLYNHATPRSVLIYFNRLSDLLFTLARVADARSGNSDVTFKER